MTCMITNAQKDQSLMLLGERKSSVRPLLPCYWIFLVRPKLKSVRDVHLKSLTDLSYIGRGIVCQGISQVEFRVRSNHEGQLLNGIVTGNGMGGMVNCRCPIIGVEHTQSCDDARRV